VVVLSVCLVVSLVANVYLYLSWKASEHHSPDTFVFSYGPEEQSIVDGVLFVNFTLAMLDDRLYIIVKINDDDYSEVDFLGLVLDTNRNGTLDSNVKQEWNVAYDKVYVAFADNTTVAGFYGAPGTPWVGTSKMGKMPGRHVTSFESGKGYVFKVSWTMQELNLTQIDTSIKLHFSFEDFWWGHRYDLPKPDWIVWGEFEYVFG